MPWYCVGVVTHFCHSKLRYCVRFLIIWFLMLRWRFVIFMLLSLLSLYFPVYTLASFDVHIYPGKLAGLPLLVSDLGLAINPSANSMCWCCAQGLRRSIASLGCSTSAYI